MGNVVRTVRYEGNPAFASLLVQTLRKEGVEVDWTPPDESRGIDPVNDVLIPLMVSGLYDEIKAGVKKFLDRGIPGAKVKIEDDEV
jgi:hypothetical protein